MGNLIRNNLGMKILSVAIAVLIWFLVSSSNDPIATKRYTNIKVNLINGQTLTESGMTYNVESGDTVDIIVKGNKSIINLISKSDFKAEADLSQLTDWGTASIQVTSDKYSDRLDIELGSTQVVKVNVEEIFTKSVKVTVNPVGDPDDNYVIGSTSSSPGLIDVEGPKSKVNKISGITVNLDVAGASETVKEKLRSDSFILYDDAGDELTSDMITFAQNSLTAQAEILKTKEIKIKLETTGEPADGYSLASLEYEPKKITVTGKESDLANVSAITLDPISVSGLTKTYTEEIKLTENFLKERTGIDMSLYDESVEAISIKAVVEKTVTKTLKFSSDDIEIRNNSENYNVTFSDNNDYKMKIRGASSVIKNVKISDFKPYINLKSIKLDDDVESETHVMNFHYTEPDNVYVISSPEGNIEITVSK